jgi:hypothetical protein
LIPPPPPLKRGEPEEFFFVHGGLGGDLISVPHSVEICYINRPPTSCGGPNTPNRNNFRKIGGEVAKYKKLM